MDGDQLHRCRWLAFWAFLPFFFPSIKNRPGPASTQLDLKQTPIHLSWFLLQCHHLILDLTATVSIRIPPFTLVYSPFLLVSLFLDRVPRFQHSFPSISSPPFLSLPPSSRSLPPCVSFEIACMGGYSLTRRSSPSSPTPSISISAVPVCLPPTSSISNPLYTPLSRPLLYSVILLLSYILGRSCATISKASCLPFQRHT